MARLLIDELDIARSPAPMILVIGQTGAGKSHFCNKVLGENVDMVRESAHLASCTSKPEMIPAKVDHNEYLLIDTPGFNDTWRDLKRSDAKILGEIAQTLVTQSELGVRLRGILYLYDISARRMTGETLRQFELIKRICGPKNYGNVLLVTTHWPTRVEDQLKQHCAVREGDLRKEFWQEMIAGGSTMCRFDDSHNMAKAIVRRLAGKPDIRLALQEEMANGNGLKKTSAFSFIVDARKQDEERYKRSITDSCWKETGNDMEDDAIDPTGIDIRKKDEDRLHDNIITRVRTEIQREYAAARMQNRKLRVEDLVKFIMSLANLAMGAAQVALAS